MKSKSSKSDRHADVVASLADRAARKKAKLGRVVKRVNAGIHDMDDLAALRASQKSAAA